MQTIAVLVGVAIAVGGWIANGYLTRRALRRQMRIEYLLSAYRRLDDASNRHGLDESRAAALESALSDIQLLGSPQQVDMVDHFVREFASKRDASSGPILDDLRSSLRRELLLGDVGPRRTWLRMGHGNQWAEASASVRANAPASDQLPDNQRAEERLGPLALQDGTQAVIEAYTTVEATLRTALSREMAEVEFVSGAQLANEARDLHLITASTAHAFEGLTAMRNLAVHRPDGVSPTEAAEFLALSDGVLFAIRHDLSRPSDG